MVRLPKFLKAAAGKAEKAKNDKLKVINKEPPLLEMFRLPIRPRCFAPGQTVLKVQMISAWTKKYARNNHNVHYNKSKLFDQAVKQGERWVC